MGEPQAIAPRTGFVADLAAARRRNRYLPPEDALIEDFARRGRMAREAAQALAGRHSRSSVIGRAIRLGVPFDPDPARVAAISAERLAAYWTPRRAAAR